MSNPRQARGRPQHRGGHAQHNPTVLSPDLIVMGRADSTDLSRSPLLSTSGFSFSDEDERSAQPMSNYRVRQVLGLRGIPERQLRLLGALATWLDDDSLTARVKVGLLMREAGLSRNTFRKARDEMVEDGRLRVESGGHGPRDLTVWTVCCLPAKGVSDVDPLTGSAKGVNEEPLRGSTSVEKGGQGDFADLRKPVQELNPRAKSSSSDPYAQVVRVRPDLTPETFAALLDLVENRAGNPEGYLISAAENGYLDRLLKELAEAEDDERWSWENQKTHTVWTPVGPPVQPEPPPAPVVNLAEWQAAKDAPPRYGKCPFCTRGPFTLKSSNGGLPVHGPTYKRCPGSHRLPMAEAK